MTVEVLAFGIAKEIFGKNVIAVHVEEPSVGSLKQILETTYPRLKQIASYMVAVNNEYATDNISITSKDEIAIIPPVSGG